MFNPQARWDRNLPQENRQDELLNEPIAVSCLFDKGKTLPRYFIWRNQLHKVKKINFFWQQRQGRAVLSYFALETNFGIYQVSFSNITLSWQMDRIINLGP
ncbi:MAG: hypothetical protein ISS45_10705 [Candidatus Omnitrophica bacterium]|nr:hypothetical protein [Candidatus Omnitrophota bacterium]